MRVTGPSSWRLQRGESDTKRARCGGARIRAMRLGSRGLTLATLAVIVAVPLMASRRSSQSLPYLDPDRPAVDRARDLVSRMTLEQKVRQMQNSAPAIPELQVPAYNWWNE